MMHYAPLTCIIVAEKLGALVGVGFLGFQPPCSAGKHHSHLHCQRNGLLLRVLDTARDKTTMSSKGIKRASPGAEEEKNPLGDVELSDEDAAKLQVVQRDTARTELALGACLFFFA